MQQWCLACRVAQIKKPGLAAPAGDLGSENIVLHMTNTMAANRLNAKTERGFCTRAGPSKLIDSAKKTGQLTTGRKISAQLPEHKRQERAGRCAAGCCICPRTPAHSYNHIFNPTFVTLPTPRPDLWCRGAQHAAAEPAMQHPQQQRPLRQLQQRLPWQQLVPLTKYIAPLLEVDEGVAVGDLYQPGPISQYLAELQCLTGLCHQAYGGLTNKTATEHPGTLRC